MYTVVNLIYTFDHLGMSEWSSSGGGAQGLEVDQGGGVGHVSRGAMRWTSVMSSFVLRKFVNLVGQGLKTNKGFKEVHLNSVARSLIEFIGQEVTGTQVYNHLRKWRQRWVKVCRLKDISGATWDENTFTILLHDEHLFAYTKVNLIGLFISLYFSYLPLILSYLLFLF